MKFEITSDRGIVGPLCWYNQQPIHYFTFDEEDGRYKWSPQIVKEGAGFTYLCFGDVEIGLSPQELFSDLWSMVKYWFGKGDAFGSGDD